MPFCECDLFCLYTLFVVAACLRPRPEPFGCGCALLAFVSHRIACFSANDCVCVFFLCMGVSPVVCAFGYDCVFGTCAHLTIPVYMAVPGTFLSARFRVTDSVPAVFTYTRARFFRYSCVCVSCLRLVLVCDGGRCVCTFDAQPQTHPNPSVNNPSLRAET